MVINSFYGDTIYILPLDIEPSSLLDITANKSICHIKTWSFPFKFKFVWWIKSSLWRNEIFETLHPTLKHYVINTQIKNHGQIIWFALMAYKYGGSNWQPDFRHKCHDKCYIKQKFTTYFIFQNIITEITTIYPN